MKPLAAPLFGFVEAGRISARVERGDRHQFVGVLLVRFERFGVAGAVIVSDAGRAKRQSALDFVGRHCFEHIVNEQVFVLRPRAKKGAGVEKLDGSHR